MMLNLHLKFFDRKTLLISFFILLIAYGCSADSSNKTDTSQRVTNIAFDEKQKKTEPRNCRANLVPKISTHGPDNEPWLTFYIEKNKKFNSTLGDDCKGNLVNLWQDLEQYDDLIAKHHLHIKNFTTYMSPQLKYFPQTYKELVLFLDDAVKTDKERISPSHFSPAKLDDILYLRREYLDIIRIEAPKYFGQKHAPIIDNHLKKHGLRLTPYITGEKISFCIAAWDNCIEYFNADKNISKNIDHDLDILYIASWDWWQVETIEKQVNR